MTRYALFQGLLICISDININDKNIMHLTKDNWDHIKNMITDKDAYNAIILLNKFNSNLIIYEYQSKRFKKHSN